MLKIEISALIEKKVQTWFDHLDKLEPTKLEIQNLANELSEEIDFIYNNEFDHFRT